MSKVKEYSGGTSASIGYIFGEALVELIKNGLKLTEFFLMGFSLGAHIMGSAGRHTIESGYTIKRIIALDPSGALYTKYIPILHPVDSSCAAYVLKIGTDPNGYGDKAANCHVNIFPNYNTHYTMQSGCTEKANQLTINEKTTCNHDMSWRLLCASRDYSSLLRAQQAADGAAWLRGEGTGVFVHISVETTSVTGSFFMRTGETYPYGLGDPGSYPQ